MGGSVNVSVRSIVVVLVVALVALSAYLIGASSDSQATATTSGQGLSQTLARTVTMTGQGEVVAVPDQLAFRVSVVRAADDVATALDASSATLERVLGALAREGVERKDTETTGLSIDPVYRYFDYQPPQITGYRVRQSISVLVRDLRAGGKAVAGAVDAGGNAVRVSGIRLEVGDTEAMLARARDAAVEEAEAKAEQYAESTGQALGEVLTIREGQRPTKPRPVFQSYDAVASADLRTLKAVPIRAGRQDVKIAVSVVWSLT